MPHLDQKGPEGKGLSKGRKLGECNKEIKEQIYSLGQGMGKRRNAGGGQGLGKRLQSSKLFNN